MIIKIKQFFRCITIVAMYYLLTASITEKINIFKNWETNDIIIWSFPILIVIVLFIYDYFAFENKDYF